VDKLSADSQRQQRIDELAQRGGGKVTNDAERDIVTKAYEAQQGEVKLTSDERLKRIGSYLRFQGASADEVAQVQQLYEDKGIVSAPPVADTTFATPVALDGNVIRLPDVFVSAQRRGEYLGNSVDVTMIGAGELVQEFGKKIEENPVAKYALMGLDIAAGPAAFAIRQGIDHSFIGDAIRNGQEAFVEHVGGKLSGVGYSDSESLSGGVGGLTLLMMGAQGFVGGVKNVVNTLEQVASRGSLRKALGLATGAPYQANHLIPVAVARDSPAIQHLMEQGLFDLNRKENGIALPNNAKLAEELGMPYHSGSHDNYSGVVGDGLIKIDRDFSLGKLNNQQLITRVKALQDEMREYLSSLKGRLN
jgi:hypothetical protein